MVDLQGQSGNADDTSQAGNSLAGTGVNRDGGVAGSDRGGGLDSGSSGLDGSLGLAGGLSGDGDEATLGVSKPFSRRSWQRLLYIPRRLAADVLRGGHRASDGAGAVRDGDGAGLILQLALSKAAVMWRTGMEQKKTYSSHRVGVVAVGQVSGLRAVGGVALDDLGGDPGAVLPGGSARDGKGSDGGSGELHVVGVDERNSGELDIIF